MNSLDDMGYNGIKYWSLEFHLFIDIFVIIPIYIIASFFRIFFWLLIIKDLAQFYLIPIDCT